MTKTLNLHGDDIDDLLIMVEDSLKIHFEDNELRYIETFGQLCDLVIFKLEPKEDVDDCTTQQAFYKLRSAIVTLKNIDNSTIQPNTLLSAVFPRYQRIKQIHTLENLIEFKLKMLRPRKIITGSVILLFIVSFVLIFFNWRYGLAGISGSLFFIYIANKTGKEFVVKTVGQLADRTTTVNYIMSRRNPLLVNKKEVVKKIEQLFIDKLGLKLKEISPETALVKRSS